MKNLEKIFITLASFALLMACSGFVFMIFWDWFVVPVFNLDSIGYGQAVGLSFFVAVFIRQSKQSEIKWDDEEYLLKVIDKTNEYYIKMVLLFIIGAVIATIV